MIKMKIIFGLLLICYLGSSNANYYIDKLDNSSGLLYVPKGKVLFREDNWNILIYTDTRAFYDQIRLITESHIVLEKLCNMKTCPLIEYTNFFFEEFIDKIELFTSLPIFDDLGSPYFFTGLPDVSIHNKITKMLNIHEKNETVQQFLDENYFLSKLEASDFYDSNNAYELRELYEKNVKLLNSLESHSTKNDSDEDNEDIFEFMDSLIIMLMEWNAKFDLLIESLQLAQVDILNYELLSVSDFIDLLEESSKYLNKDLKYPFEPTDENGIALLNTVDLKTMILGSKLIFMLTIPLVGDEDFDLYNMLPLPTMVSNNSFLYILPSTPYLAINKDKTKYATMENLNKCFRIGVNERICGAEDIYNARYSPICETELMGLKHVPKSCNINMLSNKLDIWLRLDDTNSWLFVKSAPENMEISCSKNQDVTVFGSGILSLEPKCQAKMKATTLKANSFSDNFVNKFVPKTNLLTDPCCNKGLTSSIMKRSFHDKSNIDLNNIHLHSNRIIY